MEEVTVNLLTGARYRTVCSAVSPGWAKMPVTTPSSVAITRVVAISTTSSPTAMVLPCRRSIRLTIPP